MAVNQLVVFAGQSQANSNGTTNAQTVPTAIAGPMADVYIWDPFGKTWLTYQAQVTSAAHLKGGKYPDTSQNYFGAEAEYARRWKVDNPGVPLYMVKKAHSTTSLSQDARTTDRGCWDPNLRNDLFDELVAWTADAKANLTAAGNTVNIRAMNWTQGENDAGSTAAVANAYGANLSAFIDSVRSAGVIASTTPFVISRIQTGTWANPAPVRAAQQTVGETKAYCRWFSADSVTIDGSDTVHYGPNGVVIHGDLMYEEGMSGAETAKLYASRMTVAPTAGRLTKMATFFDRLISNGLLSGISVMQIYASATEQAALVNVKSGGPVAVNSGMTFTADQGFTGTSTASFINTNVNPVTGDSKLAPGNVSYAYYVRGNLDTSGVDMGFNSTTTGRSIIVTGAKNPTTANFRINNSNTSTDNTYTGISDVSGLWSVSRKATNSCTLFNKGVQVGITDTVNTDVGESSNLIFVGNRNSSNNTSGVNGTLRQYGMFIAGSGRTPSQEAAMSDAVAAYMTAIAQPDDTTAPTLTSPSGTATGSTTATGSVTTDEAGGTLYYLANTSATATAAQVKAGASKAVTAAGAQSVSLTGLTASTVYYLHFLHADGAATPNESAVSNSASFTTQGSQAGDTTAPTLSAATAAPNGAYAATGSVTTDEGNGTLYYLASASSSQTAAQVKAGATMAISSAGAKSVAVSGLAAATIYYLYFLHTDAAGNQAATPTRSASFTTAAAPTNPATIDATKVPASRTVIFPGNKRVVTF